ncbi:MAG: S-methyl-5-thioribose-1-phosphate isomerase [archaeon]
MHVGGKHYRTIWQEHGSVKTIDQRYLPHRFVIEDLYTLEQVVVAIKDMHVRGAGLIGVAAAYGMYIAAKQALQDNVQSASFDECMKTAAEALRSTRPTAINLSWAIDRMVAAISAETTVQDKITCALTTAEAMADEDVDTCKRIGKYGLTLLEDIAQKKGNVTVLTHCNAGWLAMVDYGTALSPVYAAHERGMPLHVYVDETRPRNQGASLTAWELAQQGIPHTVIVDNVGGHLMQKNLIDIVLVGSDRTTRTGDVANKIGTYLKALAANDNKVPFYVALPSASIDWTLRNGANIPIEERDSGEVTHVQGLYEGNIVDVRVTNSPTKNYGFDVTPARLVTGLITERGTCPASEQGLLSLFPEHNHNP